MATKNGNLMAFKTSKMKETTKVTTAEGGKTDGALKPAAMSNGASQPPPVSVNPKGVVWSTLPTFMPPRDLTLGGKAPKKVFTPNLVVKRNKNLNVKTSKDTTIKRGGGAGRGGRGGGSSRGRGAKTSTLIQTKGVFSDGAGDFNLRKIASHRYGSGGSAGEDSSAALTRPIINKDDYKKVDIKADEKKLFEITGDSGDEDTFDDYKTDVKDDNLPIRLHEVERKAKIMKLKACKKENVLKNLDIKLEPDADPDVIDAATSLATAQKLQKLHVDEMLDAQMDSDSHQALLRYPKCVNNFLETTNTSLFILQLPGTLPCENDNDSKDFFYRKELKPTPMELDVPTKSSIASKRSKDKPDYDLRTMQEGQIGKVIRYKSGKTKLQLGKTFFDLDIALEPGFIQDIVSIRARDDYEQDSGAIINLGPMSAKLTATPPWEEFLLHSDKFVKVEPQQA